MRYAARVVESLRDWDRDAYDALCRRVGLDEDEIKRWIRAADSMYLPYDEALGINPQDDSFLGLEPWDFANTPSDHYPLLLHFHPLVIYRHQVLKQADVVLAMVLRSDQFPLEQKRRNFDYYDPITTGDSSLSACVQAMAAAQIGYDELSSTTSARRCSSTSPTPTATPATASTWRPAAGRGARSCSGSPACSTPARRCASRRACRRVGGHLVPHATARLEAPRRARPRRRHRDRPRRPPRPDRGWSPRGGRPHRRRREPPDPRLPAR